MKRKKREALRDILDNTEYLAHCLRSSLEYIMKDKRHNCEDRVCAQIQKNVKRAQGLFGL